MYKSKKVKKYRGSHTHGGGSKKKRRGAGNRGGRGRAGSGKKGDCKKPRYWKEKPKKGFFNVAAKNVKSINISQLQDRIHGLEKAGKVSVKAGVYDINLKELGYDKLLGAGKANAKLNITVDHASAIAVEKVQGAGGKVTVLQKAE